VNIKNPLIPPKNLEKNTFIDRIMSFISFALKYEKKSLKKTFIYIELVPIEAWTTDLRLTILA
jgi:hypothetical protein